MTIQEAVEILKEHNRWRNGEGEYGDDENFKANPHTGSQISDAIDSLVAFAELSFNADIFEKNTDNWDLDINIKIRPYFSPSPTNANQIEFLSHVDLGNRASFRHISDKPIQVMRSISDSVIKYLEGLQTKPTIY